MSLSTCPPFSLSPPLAHSFFIGPTVINTGIHTERERERERESFIRNNLHNGVVSGAARGQALRGPMWAGLTPDSKGDPTGDTGEPDRRRQETPHLSARRKGALPASPGGPPSTGQKKLRVLNPILRLYQIQSTGKSFRMRVEMCWELVWQSAARSASCEGGVCSKSVERLCGGDAGW